jgi:hypothetical protein
MHVSALEGFGEDSGLTSSLANKDRMFSSWCRVDAIGLPFGGRRTKHTGPWWRVSDTNAAWTNAMYATSQRLELVCESTRVESTSSLKGTKADSHKDLSAHGSGGSMCQATRAILRGLLKTNIKPALAFRLASGSTN